MFGDVAIFLSVALEKQWLAVVAGGNDGDRGRSWKATIGDVLSSIVPIFGKFVDESDRVENTGGERQCHLRQLQIVATGGDWVPIFGDSACLVVSSLGGDDEGFFRTLTLWLRLDAIV